MSTRKKAAILAKVHNPGSLSGKWFVYFSTPNPAKGGKLDRKKDYGEFTKYKTIPEREEYGKALAESINVKIRAGWNPWIVNGEKALYIERTAYQTEGTDREKDVDYTIKFFLNKYLNARINGALSISKARKKKRTKGKLRSKSDSTYTSKVRVFLQWLEDKKLDKLSITSFKKDHARKFSEYLLTEREISEKQGLRGRTHNNYIATLQGFFQDIIDFEKNIITENPFQEIEFAPDDTEGTHPFKDSQAAALAKYLETNRPELWLACQLIYYCFIRPGRELQNLKIGDIDLENGSIKIYSEAAKNGQTETVDIPEPLQQILSKMGLEKYPDHYYLFAKAENEASYKKGHVSCKPGLIQLSRDYLSKQHTAVQKKLGIAPKSSIYSWKHYGNIKAYKSGIGLIELMRQNRHKDISTTMEYFRNMGLLGNEVVKQKFPAISLNPSIAA